MKIEIQDLSPVKKKLTFAIPADRVSAEIDKSFEVIRKNAAIKGFRKGKVPRPVIEKYYTDKMEDDVLRTLVNETLFKALYEKKILFVSQPEIETDRLKAGELFTYSATVEVMPAVVLEDYDGLPAEKEKYVFDETVIAERLAGMQAQMAQLKPLTEDRGAIKGDFALIDFKGYFAGTLIENGSADNYQVELGSGTFVEGFEDQVVDMRIGDQRMIKVTFPEKYINNDIAGQEVTFDITLRDLKVKDLPPLDDEFAKGLGEFDTLAELQVKMAEVYEQEEHARIDADLKERLISALIERNDLEIPNALVERELDFMLESTRQRLASQRLTFEMMGLTEAEYRVTMKDKAIRQVKADILLDAVAAKENLAVTPEDIASAIEAHARALNQDVEKMKAYYQQEKLRENLESHLRKDKAINILTAKAVISEVSKEELK